MDRLLALRRAAQSPPVEKLLCHLPSVNSTAIAAVSNEALIALITPALINELAASEDVGQRVIHQLEDIANLAARMARPPINPCRSIQEAARRHTEMVDEYHKFIELQAEAARLPEPPLPGTPDIVPIVTCSQLVEEGRAQHNCVASYSGRVRKGELYIYRVLTPERATLSITKGADGCWEIQQLYRACNQPVSDACRAEVQQWLDQYSFSA